MVVENAIRQGSLHSKPILAIGIERKPRGKCIRSRKLGFKVWFGGPRGEMAHFRAMKYFLDQNSGLPLVGLLFSPLLM
jgi:hypothetical protein